MILLDLQTRYELIPILATIATLIIATYYDIKSREIAEFLWVPALVISVLSAYFVSRPNLLVLIFSLMPALIVLVLVLLKLIGGADFLAILLIGLSTPYLNVLPISLLTLFYSALIPSTTIIYNFIINTVKYRGIYLKLKCDPTPKWLLLFLGRPIKVSAFIKSKFLYPLTVFECNSKTYDVMCRTSFDISEDFKEHINQVEKCLSKGYLRPEDHIWVTPALPHILFITVGYLLSLMTPKELIYGIFKLFLGT
ncbi:MAG: A24 family peptidase C-terminal domain-containing protein [Sulfolobales archaeon]